MPIVAFKTLVNNVSVIILEIIVNIVNIIVGVASKHHSVMSQ